MSVFNINHQNANIDNKIVAGLERISQVFRILLWEKAKHHKLSPIQIQLLIFIHNHSLKNATISYLAKEFDITKATISDSIKILEQKQLISKISDNKDARSYQIQLSEQGIQAVNEIENFAKPITDIIETFPITDKLVMWQNIHNLINQLHKMDIISTQRTCFNCQHYSKMGKSHFCQLLNQKLQNQDIRIDCNEFESLRII